MMKRAKLTAQQQKKRDVLLDVLTVLFACPLISAAIAVFNVPNDIAPGGVAGLSTALAEVFPPISVGVWMVMLNTPLLLAAWRRFKRRALVMTLAATGSVAVLVDIFGMLLPAYSNNPLLAAIAGGTFTGLGAGLLLQRGISTGGTDLLALLLRRIFPNLRTGMLMLCIDISVVTFAVIVFKDIEVALYSAIAIFIVSKIVDAIAQGVDYAKVIYTVTEHGDEVSRAVTERADRGTTIVKAQGDVDVLGLVVSVDRMERGQGEKSALMEIEENYGLKTTAIVTMAEVVEHLYNKPYKGKVVIDDTLKAAIDAYYEQYGVK